MNQSVLDALKNRTSTKAFTDQEVEPEKIAQIVEAGIYAPSGQNLQSPVILVITNKEIRDRLSRENARVMGVESDPFYGAPVVLVVLADKNVRTHVYDGSVVMENLQLAAEALDLGAAWIHRAKEVMESEYGKELLEKAGLQGEYEGIGNCIIGYKAKDFPVKPRKANRVFYLD